MSNSSNESNELWRDPRVAAARILPPGTEAPSLDPAEVAEGVDRIAAMLGWGEREDPFGRVIPPGARVLVKPNWVMHRNKGPWGMAPLLTAPELIRAVTERALRTAAARVVVGDAPLQSCDWDTLQSESGIGDWGKALQADESTLRRRSRLPQDEVRFPGWPAYAAGGPESARELSFLFDLGGDSLLEEITTGRQARSGSPSTIRG